MNRITLKVLVFVLDDHSGLGHLFLSLHATALSIMFVILCMVPLQCHYLYFCSPQTILKFIYFLNK